MKPAKLFAVLFVCALCAFASEPWDDKEPKSWSQKDVEKILNKSPWAKRVATKKEYVKSQAQEGDTNRDRARMQTTRYDRGDLVEDDFVIAWWWSSKTVRRAFLRLYEFHGAQVTPEQVQEFAESPIPAPTISIMEGGQMVAIAGKLPEDQLKKSAWLESKRFEEPIFPVEVKVINDGNGTPERILFTFPEKVGDQPVVNAEDKRILFRWRLPKQAGQDPSDAQQFEASFEPNKMHSNKVADF